MKPTPRPDFKSPPPKSDRRLVQYHHVMTRVGDRVNLLLIDGSSPCWLHEQLYFQKVRFCRELGLGRPSREQEIMDKLKSINQHDFLFIFDKFTVVGGCSFRGSGHNWKLEWVWIAPQHRRCGVLSAAWPQFVRWYGGFDLGPRSDAMHAFANKLGHVEENQGGRDLRRV